MTHSEEDYIKAIYHLGTSGNERVATNAIAEQMETKPSSVTDMIRKLSEKEYVSYKKYQGVSLTESGIGKALSIVRKHRLWEVFLVDKLDFSWDEVHEIAEQLEHIKSEKLIDSLDKHLGFPKFDPHGDPIPSKSGVLTKTTKMLLNELKVNQSGICVGVKDSSAPFLKFLDKHGIALGDKITVLDKEDFDGSLHININDKSILISHQIGSNLYVRCD
ncbi:metal-dependent transcriptional regulator [Cellulophaga baltica]|uniref:metal-dependent transcriptional regulator n=1 Tax=Cellulophaga TaxID=104264 RepID=UPI001C06D633|nr:MULTISPECIES: metal-dependent transcriptional regulator [Cellulophaga]MBU2997690.1 metal-dependent transcriptional regulator [Cellulophaga baltica]MDO6769085.1 metal-dependent transcriptional regulator [Cellulophaga sp. 1_MG-2023]